MANKIVQLKGRNGDNLYPLSGGAGEGMITTPMLSDGAVTAEKIDLSTFGTVGTPTRPVYLDNGVPTTVNYWSTGDNWDQIPVVRSDGVMEIGGYLDFHRTANDTNDYDLRIYADENQVLRTSGDIRTRNGNTVDTNAANVANKENKGTTYTFAIEASSWAALSDASPYTYSTTISIPSTITVGDDTEIELLNDQPVLFATYGFAIASVSGQAVTLYSVGAPAAETTIKLKVRN